MHLTASRRQRAGSANQPSPPVMRHGVLLQHRRGYNSATEVQGGVQARILAFYEMRAEVATPRATASTPRSRLVRRAAARWRVPWSALTTRYGDSRFAGCRAGIRTPTKGSKGGVLRSEPPVAPVNSARQGAVAALAASPFVASFWGKYGTIFRQARAFSPSQISDVHKNALSRHPSRQR